ncbi:MAG: hypothetical protein RL417_2340 [Pseudomonadota bacterium]|jgi:glycerol-3-phosphate acyltransferase PlsX
MTSLPIAVDAMGGDHGPSVVVEGAVCAWRDHTISSILVGDETELRTLLGRYAVAPVSPGERGIQIRHAANFITMEDSPSVVIRGKADSSIRVALELVKKGEASAVISPGNTGAVMVASLFVLGTVPGIVRPAIASPIPRALERTPTVLLDSGATVDCPSNQLVQFAIMGSAYAAALSRLDSPRVALLSNGSEPGKGNDVTRAAAEILRTTPGLSFVGYVEGRDIPTSASDVVVCDGFVGNIALKCLEGSAALVLESMKDAARETLRGKVGLLLLKPILRKLFRERLSPSAYGGAPLLGLNGLVLICHGSAKGRAITNAIRTAHRFSEEQLVEAITERLLCFEAKSDVAGGVKS